MTCIGLCLRLAAIAWVGAHLTFAEQYEISGRVIDERQQPVVYSVGIADKLIPPERVDALRDGTYKLSLNLPKGSNVVLSAICAHPSRFGGYSWIREVVLGEELQLKDISFEVFGISTSKVSIVGRVNVKGATPKESATVAVERKQPLRGQKLGAAIQLYIPGFEKGTNTFEFFSLPDGEYMVHAQADSYGWTQKVVSVSARTGPIRVDFDFK